MQSPFSQHPSFPVLDFPEYDFTFKETDGKWEVFDFIRKKYVALTPEEWVRQHTIHFLHKHLHVPAGLMVLEKSLVLNTLSKRADVLVYGNDTKPRMLVECKSANIKITQSVFEQIARYNLIFKVKYLFVTNGINHFAFSVDFKTRKILTLPQFPDWNEMNLSKED